MESVMRAHKKNDVTSADKQRTARMSEQAEKVIKHLDRLTSSNAHKHHQANPKKNRAARDLGDVAEIARSNLQKMASNSSGQLDRHFKNIDTERRGLISYDDFSDCLTSTASGISKDEALTLASKLDTHATGLLAYDNIFSALDSVAQDINVTRQEESASRLREHSAASMLQPQSTTTPDSGDASEATNFFLPHPSDVHGRTFGVSTTDSVRGIGDDAVAIRSYHDRDQSSMIFAGEKKLKQRSTATASQEVEPVQAPISIPVSTSLDTNNVVDGLHSAVENGSNAVHERMDAPVVVTEQPTTTATAASAHHDHYGRKHVPPEIVHHDAPHNKKHVAPPVHAATTSEYVPLRKPPPQYRGPGKPNISVQTNSVALPHVVDGIWVTPTMASTSSPTTGTASQPRHPLSFSMDHIGCHKQDHLKLSQENPLR